MNAGGCKRKTGPQISALNKRVSKSRKRFTTACDTEGTYIFLQIIYKYIFS